MVRDHGGRNTRFSVLFVLAIFIPGGFLAYFSIRNIGSERALAERGRIPSRSDLNKPRIINGLYVLKRFNIALEQLSGVFFAI